MFLSQKNCHFFEIIKIPKIGNQKNLFKNLFKKRKKKKKEKKKHCMLMLSFV
jgi:hypothetical protein